MFILTFAIALVFGLLSGTVLALIVSGVLALLALLGLEVVGGDFFVNVAFAIGFLLGFLSFGAIYSGGE